MNVTNEFLRRINELESALSAVKTETIMDVRRIPFHGVDEEGEPLIDHDDVAELVMRKCPEKVLPIVSAALAVGFQTWKEGLTLND